MSKETLLVDPHIHRNMELAGCLKCMETRKPYIAVLIIQLIYAGMALLSKAAIDQGMNTYVFVAYRQAFATIFLAPFAFFLDRKVAVPLSYNILWKIFLVSLIGISLSLNLYCFALKYTSATLAAATTNIIPALTFIMAVISRVERLSITRSHGMVKVLGCLVSFCGALVFAFVKGAHIKLLELSSGSEEASRVKFSLKSETVKGALVMLSANVVWSMWYIMQAHVLKQYPAKVRLTTLQCLFSCIQSSVWAMAIVRDTSSWKLQWDINLLSVAYCGIVVTGITYWLQLLTVDKKGPVFVAMFTPLALIITALVSTFLWKETLYLGSLCGGVMLIGGLYGFLLGQNMEAKQQRLEPKEGSAMDCTTQQEA